MCDHIECDKCGEIAQPSCPIYGIQGWCQRCSDNYDPPEPDYDAPSAAERAELDYRAKRELG